MKGARRWGMKGARRWGGWGEPTAQPAGEVGQTILNSSIFVSFSMRLI